MKISLAILSFIALLLVAACTQQTTNGNGYSPPANPSPPVATPPTPTPPAPTEITPSVQAADQPITNSQVTVADVVAAAPGWIVIHSDSNGTPGPVIGHAMVQQGDNPGVVVQIDAAKATPTLWAMLHIDAGQSGVYEFPGADVPVTYDGAIVMQSFAAQQPAAPPAPPANTTGPAPMATNASVTISGFAFSPSTLTVSQGSTVTWTNQDTVAHTVTGNNWGSGTLGQGQSYSYTFNQTGTYNYHCSFHLSMLGTVIVQ